MTYEFETMDAPGKLWLQWWGDDSPDDGEPNPGDEGATWCADKIFEHDVLYIRTDIAKAANAEPPAECDAGKVSDGYHTFDELYEHRCHLFVALMRCNPSIAWRANNHADGPMFDGWFVAGMHLPTGDITYHLPLAMWEMLDGVLIATSNKAPAWDGHTAADTVKRLAAWCVPIAQLRT